MFPASQGGANRSLVAVQNYITAILIFLVIEMLMTWGFYGNVFLFLSHAGPGCCSIN